MVNYLTLRLSLCCEVRAHLICNSGVRLSANAYSWGGGAENKLCIGTGYYNKQVYENKKPGSN